MFLDEQKNYILQHSLINFPVFFINFVVLLYYANNIFCSIKTVRLFEASYLIKRMHEQSQLMLCFFAEKHYCREE